MTTLHTVQFWTSFTSQSGSFLYAEQHSGNVESFDARILGGGDFVVELQREAPFVTVQGHSLSLDALQEQILALYALNKEQFTRRGRKNLVSDARALFCYLAMTELHVTGAEAGQFLNVGSSSVSR